MTVGANPRLKLPTTFLNVRSEFTPQLLFVTTVATYNRVRAFLFNVLLELRVCTQPFGALSMRTAHFLLGNVFIDHLLPSFRCVSFRVIDEVVASGNQTFVGR